MRIPTRLTGFFSTVLVLAATLTASAGSARAAGDVEPYIIGGSDAGKHARFVARVLTQYPGVGTARCSGALVTVHGRLAVVLGAACVSDLVTGAAMPNGNITIQAGSHRLEQLKTFTPIRAEVYPGWDRGTGTDAVDDLAVLVLPRNTGLTGIPLGRSADVGRPVRMLGWGKTTADATEPPKVLQQLNSRIIAPTSCAAAGITAGEFCVDGRDGAAACLGDGPAVARSAAGRWVLLGTASRGIDTKACNRPVVFTDVSDDAHRDWIQATIAHGRYHRAGTL